LRIVGLVAVDDDDCLRLGGCGHAYCGSTQQRTSRERRENWLSHLDTPPVKKTQHYLKMLGENPSCMKQHFVNQHG
jgi:hypothetical protein